MTAQSGSTDVDAPPRDSARLYQDGIVAAQFYERQTEGLGLDFIATVQHARYLPYYNRVRLHSGLGYRSPVDYEAQHA